MSAPTLSTPAALGFPAVLVLSLTASVTRHDAAARGPLPHRARARRRRDSAKSAWHLWYERVKQMGPSGPAAAVDAQ